MTYRITWKESDNQRGLDRRIAVLEDGQGGCVEVWPALGFNAYRWAVKVGDTTHELLYADPKLFEDGRPTRSGIPILFPFPNRIRDGKYTWNGKSYQLPLTGDGGKTAIHGFACRVPWRVIDEGADKNSAWITGEFQISKDDPASLAVWPADGRLRVTYRLLANRLCIEATVDNPSAESLPFGIGYHPYFALVPFGGEEALVRAPATELWVLEQNLPTGERSANLGHRDLRAARSIAGLSIDDVLSDKSTLVDSATGYKLLGSIRRASTRMQLLVSASGEFREVVVFTPPHRQAFCIEPYTCTTDAINLHARGIDAGLHVLPPGEEPWQGHVQCAFQPAQG